MKLNIGSGNRYKKDYINLDIDPRYKVDILGDAKNLPFKNCIFNELYSRAVLEHFSWRDIFDILWEWRRVLDFGGRLIVIVPNWQWIKKEKKIAYEIVAWLFGAQRNRFDYHKSIFDKATLLMFFNQIGINRTTMIEKDYYIKAEGIK